jgi:Ni,Fe-hydrogenase III large subunit
MESETLQVVAAYGALALSIVVTAERFIYRARNDLRSKVDILSDKVSGIQSFQDRHAGADLIGRLARLEERQRTDETSLIRAEEKLQRIQGALEQLSEDIRQAE